MTPETFAPDHPHWQDYVAHMQRANMARWAVDANGQPRTPLHFLGVHKDNAVIGHISLKQQPLTCPATSWSAELDPTVYNADGTPLTELYVYTFAVDEAHRRRGIGRALQCAALEYTRAQGCYQLRSWSSLDHPENYQLKIALGFAMHPAIFKTDSGLEVSGVYFVKSVRDLT